MVTADAENNDVYIEVKYTPPNHRAGEDLERREVFENRILEIGRDPDPVGLGIQLRPLPAKKSISGVAVEISLTEDGIKLKNTNRKGGLAYRGDGGENGTLRPMPDDGSASFIGIPGSGWAEIPADGGGVHRIDFKLENHVPPPPRPPSGSTDSVPRKVFGKLSYGYQTTCAALIVTTIFKLRDIERGAELRDEYIGFLAAKKSASETSIKHPGVIALKNLKDRILELYDEIAPDERHAIEKRIMPGKHTDDPATQNLGKGQARKELVDWILDAHTFELTKDAFRRMLPPLATHNLLED